MEIFKGRLEEIDEFERRLAKKLVHVAEKNYEEKVRREFAVFALKKMAEMARRCEEIRGDRLLGRIGMPK